MSQPEQPFAPTAHALDLETYRHARDVAVVAARKAAALIRHHAGQVEATSVRDKGLNDLVTHVDEEAQRIIVAHLQSAFPDDTFLGEEGTEGRIAARIEGRRWIIDPIDGTTNFTHGVPPYAVSIALQDRSRVVVGVVYEVARDELFTAIRGGGAYVNGVRLAGVSTTPRLGEALLATGFPYRAFGHMEAFLDVLGRFLRAARGLRRPGTASVDLAYVAAGRFDGFFETGLRPWDVAAGMLLVEEAGGRVTDYRGGGDPVFDQQILASNGHIHEAMLAILDDMRDVRL